MKKCSILANKLGLEVHAGHGLDYKTTKILTRINQIMIKYITKQISKIGRAHV